MLMIITKKDKEIDSSVGMTIVYPYVQARDKIIQRYYMKKFKKSEIVHIFRLAV